MLTMGVLKLLQVLQVWEVWEIQVVRQALICNARAAQDYTQDVLRKGKRQAMVGIAGR